jgi:hypothetical protein
MRKLNSPFIFNRENWGLAAVELPEMLLDHDIKEPVGRRSWSDTKDE